MLYREQVMVFLIINYINHLGNSFHYSSHNTKVN